MKDKTIAAAVISINEKPANLEDPDSWVDAVLVYMQAENGDLYIRKDSKKSLVAEKYDNAEKGRIESMTQFLQRKYKLVYALPLGHSLSIEDQPADDCDLTK